MNVFGFDHRSEFFELADASRDASEGVEEGNNLVAGQGQSGLFVGEEDLERSAESGSLKLAPKLALLAADAVHDARDVAKVVPEFDF